MSWEDGVIDYRVPGATLLRKRDKLKRRAIAALGPAALAFLHAHRSTGRILVWRGEPLKTFRMTFLHIAKRAGIEGYSSYSLRKLGATYMRRHGVSELDIKTMLAHAIPGETGRYAHEEPKYLIEVRRTMQQLLQTLDPPWLRPYLMTDTRRLSGEDFWSRVRPEPGGCWLWSGAKTPEGFGHTGCELAHHVAFELTHGARCPRAPSFVTPAISAAVVVQSTCVSNARSTLGGFECKPRGWPSPRRAGSAR